MSLSLAVLNLINILYNFIFTIFSFFPIGLMWNVVIFFSKYESNYVVLYTIYTIWVFFSIYLFIILLNFFNMTISWNEENIDGEKTLLAHTVSFIFWWTTLVEMINIWKDVFAKFWYHIVFIAFLLLFLYIPFKTNNGESISTIWEYRRVLLNNGEHINKNIFEKIYERAKLDNIKTNTWSWTIKK